ncbi:MAG TPA: hypothetical protein VH934_10855 [Xanthobacteraceae bacterium]
MSKGRADDAPDFGAHLRRANARRLRSASWTFAAVIVLLFAANLIVPSLRLRVHAAAQIVVALYFFALGLIARSPRATAWPTSALPLLFGLGAAATGLVFNLDLMPRVGANPAYSTVMIVACLAPLWPRRLLLAMLAPAHVLYLASVWSARQTPTFVLVMTVGGTVAVVLGWFVAALQVRAERQAFDSAAAIQRQKDELPPPWRGSIACSTSAAKSWRSLRTTCKVRSQASARCCAPWRKPRRRRDASCRRSRAPAPRCTTPCRG